MNQGKTVFAQIMSLIPRYEFDKCVKRYNGNRHAIEFKCRDQFMVMSFAFDSSTVKLCLQLCPWARLHHDKGGVKMHTLLDLLGAIPTFIYLTEAAVHDSKAMSLVPVEPGNYYLMDKGYVDFKQLFLHFHRQRAFFVTRTKDNMKYEVMEEHPVDKSTGVVSDSTIRLTGLKTSRWYPDTLRMVVYEDYATGNVYRFLTNDFTHSYLTICLLNLNVR